MRIYLALAAAVGLLVGCGPKTDETSGPVVSPPEAPMNQAIDTAPAAGAEAQTPGANSYTEGQAKAAIEAAGYTGVSALTQNTQGIWMGTATKAGKTGPVSVDYKGVVTTP